MGESKEPKEPKGYTPGHMPMGEEFDRAKWTLPPLVPVLIAFVVLGAILAWYSYRSRPGIVSEGRITEMRTFPIHTKSATMTGPFGMQGEAEVYDQMIVMAKVNLRNRGKSKPLYLKSIDAKLETGAEQGDIDATQSTGGDQRTFFDYYQQFASFRAEPLSADAQIAPGQELTGMVMLSFPVTQEVWNKRKDLAITIGFFDQNPVVLHVPAGS